jgi:UDP-3-O-[3-hydroxymyristoyl] glucosamine N-acyltransferase
LATLQDAGPQQLSFLANPKYTPFLKDTIAGAVLVTEVAAKSFEGVGLVVTDPYLSYATLSHDFAPPMDAAPGVHPTAVVDPSAVIDPTAEIGPGVVVCAQAKIGANVIIGAGSFIGEQCELGGSTRLAPRVTLYRDVRIGANCLIHSGAVIGADGFGFAPTSQGWLKIAQLGGVTIGDRVEIGANTCIDRGALHDTVIEPGVIIDNQVQIAHNCRIGAGSAIAGCVGIAGSTQVGPNCTLAGQAGLAGHISLVEGTHIGMQGQVTRSITEPGQYASGTGLWPQRQWRRLVARWRRAS